MADEVIIKDSVFRNWIKQEEIQNIVHKLAEKIIEDYSGKDLVYIIVLKGAFIFGSDLIREVGMEAGITFINASSYKESMKSSGKVELNIGTINIEGKHVLIVEDIVDSGQTLSAISKDLMKMEPASVEVVAFLSKPEERIADIYVKYIGIEIPPKFVIGYGLDYAECGRHLKDIYALND